ncbi:energy transducer TonB [uncultured Microbulbifer sp.]|uniref:energy transducer TonB n=1 Tax=uncultured Microbulbifer sp. TaxID=348147 RepID=UPI0025F73AEF|nr:energy transducer TonB [uncultured Microbulbifer sp.]
MEQAYLPNSISQSFSPRFFLSRRSMALARSGALALGVTGLLLLGMTQLIATDYRAPPADPLPKIADIHMPDVKPTVQKTEPPAKPQELPPPVQPTTVDRTVKPGEVPVIFQPPTTDGTGLDPTIVSSDPLPIYKPAPRYPRRALARGIEGYVVVEFTITSSGSVRNASVVGGYDSSGQPTTVFDRAALSAVARFKYRPPMAEGQAVEQHGVRNRIVFKMAD